eukprot:11025037-Lingulodinium_polyedra.AAC.1
MEWLPFSAGPGGVAWTWTSPTALRRTATSATTWPPRRPGATIGQSSTREVATGSSWACLLYTSPSPRDA